MGQGSDPDIHTNGNGSTHPLADYEPSGDFERLVKRSLGHIVERIESEARKTRLSVDGVSVQCEVASSTADEARLEVQKLARSMARIEEMVAKIKRAILPDDSERPSAPETPAAKHATDRCPPPVEHGDWDGEEP